MWAVRVHICVSRDAQELHGHNRYCGLYLLWNTDTDVTVDTSAISKYLTSNRRHDVKQCYLPILPISTGHPAAHISGQISSEDDSTMNTVEISVVASTKYDKDKRV